MASGSGPGDLVDRRVTVEAGPGSAPGQAVSPLESVLAALADPAIAIDRTSDVAAFNAPAAALFRGLSRGEPLALALRDPDALQAVGSVLNGGDATDIEYGRRAPDERNFVLRVATLAGVGALLIFRDVSEARRIEKMRVDFVANASHELRTPLAALIGAVDTLIGPARDDPNARQTFLNMMREQAQRMRRLVDDLLSLSRIEAKGAVALTEKVDLRHVCQEAVDMLAGLAAEHNATIARDLGRSEVLILGDRDELVRLVENLVENAIRHGRANGRVEISLKVNVFGAEIAVTDDGPGIAPEHIPRLTERFYRAEPRDGRGRTGTGLGLAIVKHILQRHRGRLIIDSQVGKGSTFRVRLPIGGTVT